MSEASGSSAPRRPHRKDDDALDPGIPSLGDEGDDSPELPSFDSEWDEEEDGLLDVSAGLYVDEDEELDELDSDGDGEVDESWDDGEVEDFGAETAGWTDDASESDAGWDASLAVDPIEGVAGEDDGGAEGVEERHDLDLAELSSIATASDSKEDADADDLDLDQDGELPPLDATESSHPALLLPAHPGVVSRWLGPEAPIYATTRSLAVGRSVYRIESERVVPIGLDPLNGDDACSVAESTDGRVLVGTRSGRCWIQASNGELEMGGAPSSTEARPFYVMSDGQGRLWGRSRGGALLRSENEGRGWSRPVMPRAVLAWACDEGLLVVVGNRA
jgi:hypothetical protein